MTRKKAPLSRHFQHNYVHKVLELAQDVPIQPGEERHVDIQHDATCGVFQGDYCNCDPIVTLRPRQAGSASE
jgi:hypothetical protein